MIAALTIATYAVGSAGAAEVKPCAQIKVICQNDGCNNIETLLQRYCNRHAVKWIGGYCPGGNCTDSKPSQPAAKPDDTAVAPTPPANPVQTDSAAFNTAYEAEVLKLVNTERAKYGLAPLVTDTGVTAVAHLRAREIVTSFSHTRPNGSTCFTAAAELGVSYRSAGENIAYGYPTPEAVMTGWMHSEGHRKNILSASFGKIGIGCYQSGGVLYWSQFFTN